MNITFDMLMAVAGTILVLLVIVLSIRLIQCSFESEVEFVTPFDAGLLVATYAWAVLFMVILIIKIL